MKTDFWFQSCKALKIDSFAKKHENNDGHGGLLKDMIVDPEVVLQSADRKDDKMVSPLVIGASQLITG